MSTSQINSAVVTEIETTEVSSLDLREELKKATAADKVACYKIETIGEDGYLTTGNSGQMLYFDSIGRAGIAWGADAQWTDASSPEDAAERFLGLNDKEMCN